MRCIWHKFWGSRLNSGYLNRPKGAVGKKAASTIAPAIMILLPLVAQWWVFLILMV